MKQGSLAVAREILRKPQPSRFFAQRTKATRKLRPKGVERGEHFHTVILSLLWVCCDGSQL